MKRTIVVVAVLAMLSSLAACGSDKKPASLEPQTSTVSVITGSVVGPVVTKLAAAYKTANPTVKITVTPVLPATVKATIAKGVSEVAISTSDLFTAANKPQTFGRNLVVIAVPAANPKHVASLSVFAAKSGLRTAVCGQTTSLGNFVLGVLARASVTPAPGTVHAGCEAASVQQIGTGTLDAALMFRTNVVVPTTVKLIIVDAKTNLVFPFSYVTVGTSAATVAFGKYLATAPARAILTANGFLP